MADVAQDASEPSLAKPDDMPPYRASRPASPDKEKLRVFISYSRDDLRFADQLDAALNACGFESVIDRHGISGGEDWKRSCYGALCRGLLSGRMTAATKFDGDDLRKVDPKFQVSATLSTSLQSTNSKSWHAIASANRS